LQTNERVASVDLGHNAIGDEGAAALGPALHANASLTWLDVRANRMSAAGAALLQSAIRDREIGCELLV
jgi:hypothetical protein